ncbi:MAG TPA: HD domain-containing phosphohydrolase [Anaerolineaceae bacterium]|nr:HD domain-containing phosphohydrolase [Anaerolineaceae bacterium]
MNLTVTFSKAFNNLPLNIREKVTLPYLFLAILLLLGAAFVVTQVVFDTVEERFTNQLIESSSLASSRMVEEENQMLKSLRLLAYSQGVPEAMLGKDETALRTLTFGSILNNQQNAVEFLGVNGERLLSIYHREGGEIEDYSFSTGGNDFFTDQAFVQQALLQTRDSQGDKFAGYVTTDQGDYFFVVGPVYASNNQLAGVILVGTKLTSLVQKIREETMAQITLYDFNGRILASTFHSPMDLDEYNIRSVIHNQAQASFIRSNDSRDLNVRNIGFRELLTAWNVRGNTNLGVVGVALGETFLVSTTKVTRLQISLMTGLLLLLVIIFGVNLSVLITHPIMTLVDASKKVKDGNLDVKVEPESKDELALLTENFNQMIDSMRTSKKKIIESYDSTLEGWSKALEYRNEETKGHTDRVMKLMMKSAKGLGIEDSQMEHVRRGALLHDIGKMAIPDMILNKPHSLTHQEQEIMQMHPVYASEMLKEIEFLRPAITIPYCHHEHWDGSGYPRGLKGEQIPLEARIFALVDAWDAITTDRPYRKAMAMEEAVQTIRNEIGTHFDPGIAEKFLEVVTNEN